MSNFYGSGIEITYLQTQLKASSDNFLHEETRVRFSFMPGPCPKMERLLVFIGCKLQTLVYIE